MNGTFTNTLIERTCSHAGPYMQKMLERKRFRHLGRVENIPIDVNGMEFATLSSQGTP